MHRTFSLLAFLLSTSTLLADKITLRADNWCPYNCDPAGKKKGIVVDIAEYAFKKAGHEVQYDILNWARAVDEVKKGTYVGLVGANDSRKEFIYPANEMAFSEMCFFVRKGFPWKYTGIDSIKKIDFAIINDYDYGELTKFIKANPKLPNLLVTSGETAMAQNTLMLQQKRVSMIVEDRLVQGFYLKEMKLENEFEVAGCLEGTPVHIAFSPAVPASKEYARILSDAIVELRKSGKLKELLAGYGAEDWKK